MTNKKILDTLYDDAYSGDALPRYTGFSEENSDDEFRKKLHNKLASNAMKMINDANEEADRINQEWTPKFRRRAIIGKIRDAFLTGFGIIIMIFGLYLGYSENGFAFLSLEQLGIIFAGLGISITSLYSLVSFNDEVFHSIIISKTNENQIFADMLAIQTQLSYIRNEIMDIKKFQIKESKEKEIRDMFSMPQKIKEKTLANQKD